MATGCIYLSISSENFIKIDQAKVILYAFVAELADLACFCKAKNHNYDQAKKAMHLLYKRIRNLNLPIDLQLQPFEQTVLPIALYGCEIWAYENTNNIEKLQNEFLRYITNSKKSTPAYMLHAELGCKAVHVKIKTRMIGVWLNIVNGK